MFKIISKLKKENKELTKEEFIKKFGEEALKDVSKAPITHERGEYSENSK